MPRKTQIPDIVTVLIGEQHLFTKKWYQKKRRKISFDDAELIVIFAKTSLEPGFESFDKVAEKFGAEAKQFSRLVWSYPEEAPQLFIWARAEAQRRSETALHRAKNMLDKISMEAKRTGKEWTAQTVASALSKKYGGKNWIRTVEDSIKEARKAGAVFDSGSF